jgi:hypothetical protein
MHSSGDPSAHLRQRSDLDGLVDRALAERSTADGAAAGRARPPLRPSSAAYLGRADHLDTRALEPECQEWTFDSTTTGCRSHSSVAQARRRGRRAPGRRHRTASSAGGSTMRSGDVSRS